MDNETFTLWPEREIKKCLDNVKYSVNNGLVYGTIIDSNGNKIGKWEIITED